MIVKKILFFAQNSEQLQNMLEIEKEICDVATCFYADTSNIYDFKLSPLGENSIQVDCANHLNRSFYRLKSIERINYLFLLRNSLKDISKNYDLIVFGNDGAVQRLLNYYVQKAGNKTVIVLDGMISDYGYSLNDIIFNSDNKFQDVKLLFKNKLVEIISKSFSGTALSPFLPNLIGSSNINEIYTIGPHSKKVIEARKHKSTAIFDFGLPRMSNKHPNKLIETTSNTVCYITGAYKWHGLHSYDKYQHRDIQMLIECLNKFKPSSIVLYIRIHPRETSADYAQYFKNDNVFMDECVTVEQSFEKYTCFITQLSTCIVEGMRHGTLVHSMMINFPFWKIKRSFIGDENVIKITSCSKLEAIIESLLEGSLKDNLVLADNLISGLTNISALLISNNIRKLLYVDK